MQPIVSWEWRRKRMNNKLHWLHTPREYPRHITYYIPKTYYILHTQDILHTTYPRQPEQHQTQSAPVRLLTCGGVCVVNIRSPLDNRATSHSACILVRPALQLICTGKSTLFGVQRSHGFRHHIWMEMQAFSGYTYSVHLSVF